MATDVQMELAAQVEAFEAFVLDQQPVSAAHYDDHYFTAEWREGSNRYELETRRAIEAKNPALIKEVFDPRRVLDLGCGPGFLMHFLHELGVEVDGVDFSPSSKALALDDVRDRIRIGSVTAPPVEPGAYDLVVCREVLEHLTVLQVRQTVAQICSASSRYAYVTTRFHLSPAGLLDVTTQFDVDPTHVTLMTKPFLRCLFVLEGFRARPDLEARMDWANKDRVLVYERVGATC
jgi:cyclopropane fatty-acyl-phospholipid synthase-like methyltransferase